MEFFRRAARNPASLGVFPGAFNPPTRAHLAIARAALSHVDEVVFVVPRVFPHKDWSGAAFEDRIRMLEIALSNEPCMSVAATERGLFIQIARECREPYGRDVDLWFLCGADAAERIINWDYGEPGAIRTQLREYGLLVAPRGPGFSPPEPLRERVRLLSIESCDEISATAVREQIRRGGAWRQLVPESIVPLVGELYS